MAGNGGDAGPVECARRRAGNGHNKVCLRQIVDRSAALSTIFLGHGCRFGTSLLTVRRSGYPDRDDGQAAVAMT